MHSITEMKEITQEFREPELLMWYTGTWMGLERLQTRLVERLVKILVYGQSLQLGHLDNLRNRIHSAEVKLNQVKPSQDQILFINHNIRPFSVPGDWKFEPCVLHYDTVRHFSKLFAGLLISRLRMAWASRPPQRLSYRISSVVLGSAYRSLNLWFRPRVRDSLSKMPIIIHQTSTESDFDRLYKKLQNCKFDHSIGEIDNVVDVSASSSLISSLPFKQLMTSTVGLSRCATPAGNLSQLPVCFRRWD